MAIEFKKSDTTQKTISDRTKAVVRTQNDAAASKAKVEGSSPSVSANIEKQMREASKIKPPSAGLVEHIKKLEADHTNMLGIVQKHKERLAYNAAYQRDLRTIKRLGLNCTVKEYRENFK